MLDVGLIGKAIAGAALGLGLIWWVVKRLNRAEADRIDAFSLRAHTQGQIEANAAQEAVNIAANTAQEDAKNAPPTDW